MSPSSLQPSINTSIDLSIADDTWHVDGLMLGSTKDLINFIRGTSIDAVHIEVNEDLDLGELRKVFRTFPEQITQVSVALYDPDTNLDHLFECISQLESVEKLTVYDALSRWRDLRKSMTSHWTPDHEWTFSGSGVLSDMIRVDYDNITIEIK
jgi:hypothetical protein